MLSMGQKRVRGDAVLLSAIEHSRVDILARLLCAAEDARIAVLVDRAQASAFLLA